MKQIKIPCEVYTRCVGFYRPTSQFNPGKKSEFNMRKTYIVDEKILDKKSDNGIVEQ